MKQNSKPLCGVMSRWAVTGAAWIAMASRVMAQVPGYTIATVAGGGSGGDGGAAVNASLSAPTGIAVDAAGNLYIAETLRSRIRRVAPGGTITTAAGGGSATQGLVGDGGLATNAVLNFPTAVAVDTGGNLYIADTNNGRIRKVSTNGTITTVAGPGSSNGVLGDGGPATSATLASPVGLAFDPAGNLYIADRGHNRVRKVTLDGTITTVAGGSSSTVLGDGEPAVNAALVSPTAVAVDATGNLYIWDSGHYRIRKVSAGGVITTVVGNGTSVYYGDGGLAALAAITSTNALFSSSLAVDGPGNLYLADSGAGRLRVVTTDGIINSIAGDGTTTLNAGNNGPATSTGLPSVAGVALGGGGTIYVSQTDGFVRVLTPSATPVVAPPTLGLLSSASAFGQFKQLAAGSWVEIYGSYLGPDSRSWSGDDFNGATAPTSLDGTSVTIGGQPAFISYVSPGQINAQVPTSAGTGSLALVVTTRTGKTAPVTVTVNGVQPGLLAPSSFNIGTRQYAVALLADGATFVLPAGAIAGVPSRPAKAGETITLYGIGFGSVLPNIPAGQVVQASNELALPFHLFFGSTAAAAEATITYAGLAPGLVGMYQFNAIVPKLSLSGAVPLYLSLGGAFGTQSLYIAVQ